MAAQIPNQHGQLVEQHDDPAHRIAVRQSFDLHFHTSTNTAAAAARNTMLKVLDTSVTFRSPMPRKKP